MNQQLQPQTFGHWAHIALAKHLKKILKHEAKVLLDKDPEELHQMRVGMRRLRSAISGFDRALDLPPTVSAKQIGRMAKILGKLRDLDVLQATLNTEYLPQVPKTEQKHLKLVIKQIKQQRKQALKKVRKLIKSDLYSKFKQDLSAWLINPQYQAIADMKLELVLPNLLLPQVCTFLLHSGWLIGTEIIEGEVKNITDLDIQDVEKLLSNQEVILHDLRKEAKRLRYNLAVFSPLYSQFFQDYLLKIKEIQEILGDIQDSSVLENYLTTILEQNVEQEIPAFIEIIRKHKHLKWQQWSTLKRYFSQQKNQDIKNILLYPKLNL